jgi:CDP-6-deoxy-D-xylo-4-hexulose-3-dehydrase
MRSTELNGLLGLEQLARLDGNNLARTQNFKQFLSVINSEIFQTEFKVEGSSNYAFTLVLKKPDMKVRDKVEKSLREAGIEFRRGLSGGGNQLRQPYLLQRKDLPEPESMSVADHIHHYAWYVGNYPELEQNQIKWLGSVLSNLG